MLKKNIVLTDEEFEKIEYLFFKKESAEQLVNIFTYGTNEFTTKENFILFAENYEKVYASFIKEIRELAIKKEIKEIENIKKVRVELNPTLKAITLIF